MATPVDPAPGRAWLDRRFALLLLLIWVAAAALYIWVGADAAAKWNFPDPDDQMRLLQVRDWLGGQSWWDVTQYRMNPPVGAPMHWSRLVDLPIAGSILAARHFATPHGAELFALTAVPLATLGAAMALTACVARRLLGAAAGLIAAALAPFTTGALQQLHTLRIDHHGWQMVLAMAILLAALDRRPRRGGIVAGLCAATWLTISLEGLPFAAATGALFAMRWLAEPRGEARRLEGFALALAIGAAVLFAGTHAKPVWGAIHCDAIAPQHLLMFALAAAGAAAATRLTGGSSLPVRLATLGVTALACGAAFLGVAPQCRGGAFVQLDPLVFRYWYSNVPEGLPLWVQGWRIVVNAVAFPLIGLAGALVLRARAPAGDRRAWGDYLFLLLASIAVTLTVQRAGAVANLVAVPAGVALTLWAVGRAQRLRHMLPRVLASTGAALALLPMTPALVAAAIPERGAKPATPTKPDLCNTSANLATAGRLPPAILFTAIDLGPGILMTTDQRVIASGHHRNVAGLHDTLAAFLSPPAQAQRIIAAHRARYVVVCPKLNEMDVNRRIAPRGLWGQLAAGRIPGWLRRVRVPGSELAIWEVVG